MVRIKTNDIFITDDDKIVFGDNFDSELFWDPDVPHVTTSGDLRLTTTISGVDPTEDYHLTTKYYVDSQRYTDEEAQDAVGTIISGAGNVTVIYDDANNTITVSGSGGGGGEFYYAESERESTTTNTRYQDKTTLTINNLEAGMYRIHYSCEYRCTSRNKFVAVRVYDSTNASVIAEGVQRTNAGINWFSHAGTKHIDLSDAVSQVFKWQYREINGAIIIRRARLEVRRVSECL
jgi:hypothetical protein